MKLLLFLFLFWCMWFLNFTTRTIFSPLLPVIEDELGITHALAGSLLFFQSVGYAISLLLTSILVGFLADRYGGKRIILIAFITTGLSTMAMAVVTSPPVLVFLIFLQASFSTTFFPVGFVAISRMAAPSERSAFTGAAMAAGVIFGFGLTPLLWVPSQTSGVSRSAFSDWDSLPFFLPGLCASSTRSNPGHCDAVISLDAQGRVPLYSRTSETSSYHPHPITAGPGAYNL